MKRLLLLVESNTTGTGRLFAQRAATLGITPVMLTSSPARYPYIAHDAVDYIEVETSDPGAVLAAARALGRDADIAGAFSSSEYYIETAAVCAKALGLPGPPPEPIRACRHKGTQRQILAAAGLGGPRFVRASTVAGVLAAEILYPVVVKPCSGSGSVGVRLCADDSEAATHAATLLRATENERGLAVPAEILVEEYMTGQEYSVELFAGRPVATVDKHLGPLPWFVEVGHDTPSRLPADRERMLTSAARDAVAALNLTWGAAHVELNLGPRGARIVEVNPRLAGGMIPDLVLRAYGTDLIDSQIRANPEAHRIVYGENPGADSATELHLISEVDRAHLVMLTERGIVDAARSAALLTEIERLRGDDFAELRDRPMPRGLYLAYEGLLTDLLGDQTAGVLHTGRSRNDLNATTTRLRTRGAYVSLLEAVAALARTLLDRSAEHQRTVMPAYTHRHPAVPITYGHYLAGVAASIIRGHGDLLTVGEELESCPLGAGAVGGTSIPIDPSRTAELLGFCGPTMNSVDAVASRDYALRLLAAAATLGVTITRITHDLSNWTSEESGLLRLADDLVGGSSMMPQKRNPFLLENIHGKATASLGHYVGAATAMATAGYTNAISVGTEAIRQLWPGLQDTTDAATLLRLVIDGATPDQHQMLNRAVGGFTAATYYAERLTAQGLPFRTAHHHVGRKVLAAIAAGESLRTEELDGLDLDPATVAEAAAYGGGPGGGSTEQAVAALCAQLDKQHGTLVERTTRWASAAGGLDQAVSRVLLREGRAAE